MHCSLLRGSYIWRHISREFDASFRGFSLCGRLCFLIIGLMFRMVQWLVVISVMGCADFEMIAFSVRFYGIFFLIWRIRCFGCVIMWKHRAKCIFLGCYTLYWDIQSSYMNMREVNFPNMSEFWHSRLTTNTINILHAKIKCEIIPHYLYMAKVKVMKT